MNLLTNKQLSIEYNDLLNKEDYLTEFEFIQKLECFRDKLKNKLVVNAERTLKEEQLLSSIGHFLKPKYN